MDVIKKFGKIHLLEKYRLEGLYYIRYPMPWLVSSFISIITSTSSQISELITYATAYAFFMIFLILIINSLKGKASSLLSIASTATIFTLTLYLSRPFQDLVADSFGLLSLAVILYLFFRFTERPPIVLLALIIPLVIAHGLAVYISTFTFIFLAISYLIAHTSSKKVMKSLEFAIIIFIGTWLYQVGVQLIDMFVKEIPCRWNLILKSLSSPLFQRGKSSEIATQNLHLVYPLDPLITPLAYMLPIVIIVVSSMYFLYKFMHGYDYKRRYYRERCIETMAFSLISITMFSIAGIFAWKGFENAIARYLYEYAALIATVVNIMFLSSIIGQKKPSPHKQINRSLLKYTKVTGLAILAIVGVLIVFESFYTPYASPLSIPDKYKFERLYQMYYGKVMFNANLAIGVIKYVLEASQRGEVQVITMTQAKHYETTIYNNGFVVTVKR
ncbi:hypothetical protein [Staphylothermus hellenicus]|uniref:hypothetical protein n=1 Tax=Staphylothermus hellenicus TaxID=84599 RepID=UPI00164F5152|nr:hypothetical protein [Staphylothermus hellenicus]